MKQIMAILSLSCLVVCCFASSVSAQTSQPARLAQATPATPAFDPIGTNFRWVKVPIGLVLQGDKDEGTFCAMLFVKAVKPLYKENVNRALFVPADSSPAELLKIVKDGYDDQVAVVIVVTCKNKQVRGKAGANLWLKAYRYDGKGNMSVDVRRKTMIRDDVSSLQNGQRLVVKFVQLLKALNWVVAKNSSLTEPPPVLQTRSSRVRATRVATPTSGCSRHAQCPRPNFCSEAKKCEPQRGVGGGCKRSRECSGRLVCAKAKRADKYGKCAISRARRSAAVTARPSPAPAAVAPAVPTTPLPPPPSSRASGQNCTANSECQSGLCQGNYCRGRSGASCGLHDHCASNSFCNSRKECEWRRRVGGGCAETRECREGFLCERSGQQLGRCVARTLLEPPASKPVRSRETGEFRFSIAGKSGGSWDSKAPDRRSYLAGVGLRGSFIPAARSAKWFGLYLDVSGGSGGSETVSGAHGEFGVLAGLEFHLGDHVTFSPGLGYHLWINGPANYNLLTLRPLELRFWLWEGLFFAVGGDVALVAHADMPFFTGMLPAGVIWGINVQLGWEFRRR